LRINDSLTASWGALGARGAVNENGDKLANFIPEGDGLPRRAE
jgi:hypothetical protein